MTVCAIMQPTYLPWLGYFDLMDQADVFILLDDVQLTKRSWQVRNRIRRSDGAELMLSIPVKKTRHRDALVLAEAEVNDETGWRRKHLASLDNSYSSARHGTTALAIWQAALSSNAIHLVDLHEAAIRGVMTAIGLDTKILRASALKASGRKDAHLLALCRAVGATHYLSALGSAAYISANNPQGAFADSGIGLSYQHFDHPVYDQSGRDFMPYLGVVDLLAHVGPDQALDIIRSGRGAAFSPTEAQARVQAA